MAVAQAAANCVATSTRTPSTCLGSIASPTCLPDMDLAIKPYIVPGLTLLGGGLGSSLGSVEWAHSETGRAARAPSFVRAM